MKQPLQTKSLFVALLLFLVTMGASAQTPTPTFTLNVTQTPAQCAGTGRLAFNIATGLNPDPLTAVSFTVYQGTGTGGTVVGTILTPPYELPNLDAGTYTVQATQTLLGVTIWSVPFTITITSTTARPTYRPDIVGVRCGNDGQVTIVTLTGFADTYSLYIEGGALIAGPQASPTFSNLGVGRYVVRAQNRCGDSRDITVPIIQENTDVNIDAYIWPFLNPAFFPDYYELYSCNQIQVLTPITAPAPSILFYPLTLTYTVTSPTGVVTVVTQTVQYDGQIPSLNVLNVVSSPLPFYHDVDYTYDLTVTNACGTSWTRNNNLIHETFTAQAQDLYDHCDELITFTVANYVSPVRVNFLTYTPVPQDPNDPNSPLPGSFDVVNDPIRHNPDHLIGHPAGPISYTGHMPIGEYCVELIDACGRVFPICVTVNPPPQDLILTPAVACNATVGGINATWARMVTFFDTTNPWVHIIPPYPAGVPWNTSLPFYDISAGIDPNNPSSLAWAVSPGNPQQPQLPFGTYTVEARNECGEMFTKTVTLTAGGTSRLLAFNNRPGCTVGYGSVQVYQQPMIVPQEIAGVKILSSTSAIWTAANPAAVDVSANIATNNRMFYMNDLPEGDYEFEVTDLNGCTRNITVTVVGYHYVTKNVTTSRDCTTFSATIDVVGDNPGTAAFYWLQKWDPVLNDWVHPISGVRYPAGTTPVGQNINVNPPAAGDNSVLLTGPAMNNGVLVPGLNALYGNGDFRIIESYSVFGNGVSSGARCITTLATISQGGAPAISGIFSFPCSSSSGEAVVSATGITNAGFPNLLYSIIAKQGDPSFVPIGPQVSNVFANLDPGVGYTFTVQDACAATSLVAQVQPAATMAITQTGTCVGQPLTLSIPEYPFLDYEWYNAADPATVLSTNGVLAFTPYTNANAGTYGVRVTNPGNPGSCLNQTFTQVLGGTVLPEAGTPVTGITAICTSPTATPVDLTSYLTGEDTGGVFAQSTATPGGVLTGSSFDITSITTNGTFDFTYTVSDACGNSDIATITVTTAESPAVPTVNTLPIQCEGNTFTLTAVSTTSGVTYEWTTPRGNVTGASVVIDSTNPATIADSGAYTVTVSNGNCTSTETVNITVTAAPNAGVGATVNICNTTAGTLESLETAAYLGATFDRNGTWTDISAVSAGAKFNDANGTLDTSGLYGTYQFRYEVTACGTTVNTVVTINLNATPGTPVLTPAVLTVCANATVQIDTPAVAGATYIWTLPNGDTQTTTGPQLRIINASPASHNGQYSLVVTVNNCPSIAGTTNVDVVPLPLAGSNGTDTICTTATSATLTLTTYLGGIFDTATSPNTASVAWTLVSATTPINTEFNATNGTFATANLAGTFVFKYTVTSSCGAVDDADVTIILNATPAQPVANAVATTVCENNAINLSTTTVTGASYQWFKNGTAIPGATSDIYTISSAALADTADYSVTVTVRNCTSDPSAIVGVTVTPLPQFTVAADNTVLCPGQPTTIRVTPVNFALTDANITYTWSVDGVVDTTLTGGVLNNVTTTDDVVYSVVITNTNGTCPAPAKTVNLTIDRNPFTVVLQAECVNDHLILSIANIDEIGATREIAWSGPGVSETGNDPQIDITGKTENSAYTATVTNINGCVKDGSLNVERTTCIIPKGISPDNGDQKNDFFDLTYLNVENLQIFNRYGLQVYEKNNYTKEWFGQSDKGDLPTGTYFYVVKTPGKQVTGWVYIQRNN